MGCLAQVGFWAGEGGRRVLGPGDRRGAHWACRPSLEVGVQSCWSLTPRTLACIRVNKGLEMDKKALSPLPMCTHCLE